VLLRVLEVGICGTDRDIAAFEYGDPPTGSDHLILGHEAVAEVLQLGENVTTVRAGELVIPTVRRPCGGPAAGPARVARQDFCTTGEFTERGIKQAHGYLTELVVEDEHNLITVPPPLADVAALVEPISIAAKAAEQAQAVQQRLPWEREKARILVLGAGPIGMLGAVAMDRHRVRDVVYSREPADSPRADKVRELGATYLSDRAGIGRQDLQRRRTDRRHLRGRRRPGRRLRRHRSPGAQRSAHPHRHPRTGRTRPLPLDRIMKNLVLNNQAIVGTVNAGRSAFALAVQKLEQACTSSRTASTPSSPSACPSTTPGDAPGRPTG
jgi:hypothetical protein